MAEGVLLDMDWLPRSGQRLDRVSRSTIYGIGLESFEEQNKTSVGHSLDLDPVDFKVWRMFPIPVFVVVRAVPSLGLASGAACDLAVHHISTALVAP